MEDRNAIIVEDDEQKNLRTNERVVSYYSPNHKDLLKKYGTQIGSSRISNTVRCIVVGFLNNHFNNDSK